MKKIVSILLIVCMAVGLFACTNSGSENKDVSVPTDNPQVIEVPETTEDPLGGENSIYSSPYPDESEDPNWTINIPEQLPTPEPVIEVQTAEPTQVPTSDPTQNPTETPTQKPTSVPTEKPTQKPTQAPTAAPTADPTATQTEVPTQSPEEYTPEAATYTGNFTRDLEKFLRSNGYNKSNFIVSPTSYRAALCLAIAGASGETKERLIKAAGFSSQSDANSWYNNLMASITDFKRLSNNSNGGDGEIVIGGGDSYDVGYEIANSIWNNSDKRDNFKQSYIDYVKSHYGADANSIPGNNLPSAINNWCEEKTHGLIKNIASPEMSSCASILANALYIKDAWCETFRVEGDKTFHTISGSDVTKEFVTNTDKYRYYEDENTRLVVIPMYGNKEFVLVIGNTSGILSKVNSAETHTVKISMPKMNIETTYAKKEFVNFIIKRGAGDAVDPEHADFSELYSEVGMWYIDDVVQKAKIKTDEKGLEAAAVTIIVVAEGAVIEEPEEPIEFTADVPFSFYIVDTYNSINEILFFGQMVK